MYPKMNLLPFRHLVGWGIFIVAIAALVAEPVTWLHIVLMCVLYWAIGWLHGRWNRVTLKKPLSVYGGANPFQKKLERTVSAGERVFIGPPQTWYYIGNLQGKRGWVEAKDLEVKRSTGKVVGRAAKLYEERNGRLDLAADLVPGDTLRIFSREEIAKVGFDVVYVRDIRV